jgi:hypothetical protein
MLCTIRCFNICKICVISDIQELTHGKPQSKCHILFQYQIESAHLKIKLKKKRDREIKSKRKRKVKEKEN